MPADVMAAEFTFEEVEDGFEISSESGTIMVRKVGEGQIALPVGSVMPMQLLDDGGIVWFEKTYPDRNILVKPCPVEALAGLRLLSAPGRL